MSETFETIRYTADVVVIRGDEVLVIERGWPPHQGMLALPGGHVDAGETSLAAAGRELLEETGVRVDVDALTLVGVYDGVGRDPRGRYVSVAYAVAVPAGTVARAGDDAAAVRWVPLADPGELAFDHARIVADAWRQQLATVYARQVEVETSGGRCPAAHPSDLSGCAGPVAVTVVDRSGAGADGCELHAARMLASLTGARVYGLPDAPAGAAIRTHTAAAKLPPFAWRQPLVR
ncbi:NUDIX domain-containing protein [Streptomyces sp. NPDC058049]|uniref:NUDIX domain-containing protein n=1 Tax=Streptomyces sp. NPDC058049 TaxID=3346314 RepID=UPI0036DFD6CF